jgi:hypothetical protein
MQKKMQKVERVVLRSRMNSGFQGWFDSTPGHHRKCLVSQRLTQKARKSDYRKRVAFLFSVAVLALQYKNDRTDTVNRG